MAHRLDLSKELPCVTMSMYSEFVVGCTVDIFVYNGLSTAIVKKHFAVDKPFSKLDYIV